MVFHSCYSLTYHGLSSRLLLLSIVLLAILELSAQEFHYWNAQVGAKPSMLAGAVTAADEDNSAIYYNPGALGFIENSKLSLSSDTYYYSWILYENGAGANQDLFSAELNLFPQIIAYNQKIPKVPITLTLAAINRDASFINMSYRNEGVGNYIEELPGDEIYVGVVDYYNRLRDNWIGFGYGRKLGEHWGLGFSAFLSIRAMEYRYTEAIDYYKVEGDTLSINLVSNVFYSEYLDMRNVGMIFMLGFSHQKNRFRFGVNIIFPRINLRFIGNSNMRRSFEFDVPSIDTNNLKISVWQEKVKSNFRMPFTVDVGFEYDASPSTTLYAKGSWFAPVGKYAMIVPDNNPSYLEQIINAFNPEFNNIYLANKMVVNIAMAFQTRFNDKLALLGGFRTDFCYFDESEFDMDSDFFPGITLWDIYHLSCGVVWTQQKFDLSLGGSYSIGRRDNLPQMINLDDPNLENYPFSPRSYSANVKYNQISLFLGFTYFFPKI